MNYRHSFGLPGKSPNSELALSVTILVLAKW